MLIVALAILIRKNMHLYWKKMSVHLEKEMKDCLFYLPKVGPRADL